LLVERCAGIPGSKAMQLIAHRGTGLNETAWRWRSVHSSPAVKRKGPATAVCRSFPVCPCLSENRDPGGHLITLRPVADAVKHERKRTRCVARARWSFSCAPACRQVVTQAGQAPTLRPSGAAVKRKDPRWCAGLFRSLTRVEPLGGGWQLWEVFGRRADCQRPRLDNHRAPYVTLSQITSWDRDRADRPADGGSESRSTAPRRRSCRRRTACPARCS
jgi:hypothetical protein